MGPRSCERGNDSQGPPKKASGKLLQWGRAHVSAETFVWRERLPACVMVLQWGRAHVSAETRSSMRLTSSDGSLQWGRAHVSAETRGRPSEPGRQAHRFNGAALM